MSAASIFAELQQFYGLSTEAIAQKAHIKPEIVYQMQQGLPVSICQARQVLGTLAALTHRYHLAFLDVPVIQVCPGMQQTEDQKEAFTLPASHVQAVVTAIDFYLLNYQESAEASEVVGTLFALASWMITTFPRMTAGIHGTIIEVLASTEADPLMGAQEIRRLRYALHANASQRYTARVNLQEMLQQMQMSPEQIVAATHLDMNTVGCVLATNRGTEHEILTFLRAISAIDTRRALNS